MFDPRPIRGSPFLLTGPALRAHWPGLRVVSHRSRVVYLDVWAAICTCICIGFGCSHGPPPNPSTGPQSTPGAGNGVSGRCRTSPGLTHIRRAHNRHKTWSTCQVRVRGETSMSSGTRGADDVPAATSRVLVLFVMTLHRDLVKVAFMALQPISHE